MYMHTYMCSRLQLGQHNVTATSTIPNAMPYHITADHRSPYHTVAYRITAHNSAAQHSTAQHGIAYNNISYHLIDSTT